MASSSDRDFELHVVVYTKISAGEMRALVGIEPRFFREGPRTFPSGRVEPTSVYDYSILTATQDLSLELSELADWLARFLPRPELAVKVAVLVPSAQTCRLLLSGDAVSKILRLGVTVDFDGTMSDG